MKKIIFIILIAYQMAWTQSLPKSEYIDPLNREVIAFKEYSQITDFGRSLQIETVYRSKETKNREPLVKVIVNNFLYTQIEPQTNIYIADLENEGYAVELEIFTGGTAENIKAELINSYYNADLQGVVFIGNLPLAWYEETGNISWEFPIDLFYMDMDGDWFDYDDNGIYDGHTGETSPEIWVGRLNTSRLTWDDEASMINNYFMKNHDYRIGNLSLPFRALGFFDDGLVGSAQNMDLIYPEVDIISADNITTAENYKTYLQLGYYHVHLSAHSSPWGATFKINNQQPGGGTFFNYDVYSTLPEAFFYTFVCCMHDRFIELNNIGSWYLYSSNYGLIALGSTKTTYGVEYDEYYSALSGGSSIGDALVTYLNQSWYASYLKGLTILGDPTLVVQENDLPDQNIQEYISEPLDNYQIQISQVTTHPMTDCYPVSTIDLNNNLWLIWDSGRYVRSDQYVSSYDGNSWSEPETVGYDEYWDLHPDIIFNGSNIWAVWQSFRQYHDDDVCNFDIMSSSDYNWTHAMNISDPDLQNMCYEVEPRLAVDNDDNVFVVWKRETVEGGSIYFSKYENSLWDIGEEIVSDMAMINDPVLVFDDDNNGHLFFESDVAGYKNIYHSIYSNDVWSYPDIITDNDGNSLEPEAVVDDLGTIWLFYRATCDYNTDIYCRSFNGFWSDEIQVTNNDETDVNPTICKTGDGKIWVAWARKGVVVKYDIYLRIIENGQFLDETIISTNPGNDMSPDICPYQDGVAVFWQTDRNDNWDIYYATVSYESNVDDNCLAGSFLLNQNYPNPFNPATIIRYELPVSIENANIEIYNIKGQLVDKLFINNNQASIEWNAEVFSSGIYLYKFSFANSPVKKMLLLK